MLRYRNHIESWIDDILDNLNVHKAEINDLTYEINILQQFIKIDTELEEKFRLRLSFNLSV